MQIRAGNTVTGQVARLLKRRLESVIDESVQFDGQLRAENDLRIQGVVGGEIRCHGTVTIEEQAVCNASIDAEECLVYGAVSGDITCSGRIVVAASAVVNASMRAGILSVEQGARVRGFVDSDYAAGNVDVHHEALRAPRRNDSGEKRVAQ